MKQPPSQEWGLPLLSLNQNFHPNLNPQHLQRYCDEYATRYNTGKKKDHERFEKHSDWLLNYSQLIGK